MPATVAECKICDPEGTDRVLGYAEDQIKEFRAMLEEDHLTENNRQAYLTSIQHLEQHIQTRATITPAEKAHCTQAHYKGRLAASVHAESNAPLHWRVWFLASRKYGSRESVR